MTASDKFTIIRDTREKPEYGWSFPPDAYCAGTVISHLDTGDYSIEGLEDFVVVERKRTIDEFAHNCVEKRWVNCMVRMSARPHRFLIFEFPWSDVHRYPHSSKVPRRIKKKLRISAKFIMRNIHIARNDYGIHVLACKDARHAERAAYRILRKAHELRCRSG